MRIPDLKPDYRWGNRCRWLLPPAGAESENQNPGSQTRFSMEESLPKAFAAAAFLPPTPGQTPLASR